MKNLGILLKAGWSIFRLFFLSRFGLSAYLRKFPSDHNMIYLGYSHYETNIQKHYLQLYLLTEPEPIDYNIYKSRVTLYQLCRTQENRRVIIFGDPGSGKTTLLAKTAIDLAINSDSDRLIPVIVRLRDFHDVSEKYKEEKPQDVILSTIAEKLMVDIYNWNDKDVQLLASHLQFVLMFDGLDELNPQDRYFIIKGIEWLSETFSRLYIVISSRTALYENFEGLPPFKEFWIAPINPLSNDSYHFLNGISTISIYSKSFIDIITKNRDLCDFLSTPFFLILAAYLYVEKKEDFPSTKVLFYNAVCKWFLYKHRKGVSQEIINYWYADKRALCEKYLEILAYSTLIAEKTHRTVILKQDILTAYNCLVSEDSVEIDIKSLISHLSLRHGALRLRMANRIESSLEIEKNVSILDFFNEDRYEFFHKSLHEFYAARRLVRTKQTLNLAEKEHLIEVEQFRKSIIGEEYRTTKQLENTLDLKLGKEVVQFLADSPEYTNSESFITKVTNLGQEVLELLCSNFPSDRLISEVEDIFPNTVYNTMIHMKDIKTKLDVSLKCLAYSLLKTDRYKRRRFIFQMFNVASEVIGFNEQEIKIISKYLDENPIEMSKIFELWRIIENKEWMMHLLRVRIAVPEQPLDFLAEIVLRWTEGFGKEILKAFIECKKDIRSYVKKNQNKWPYKSNDFRGIYLSDVSFLVINTVSADFSYASFRGTNIPLIYAPLCKFVATDFSKANIKQAYFLDADLRYTNWIGSKVQDGFYGGAQTHGIITDPKSIIINGATNNGFQRT